MGNSSFLAIPGFFWQRAGGKRKSHWQRIRNRFLGSFKAQRIRNWNYKGHRQLFFQGFPASDGVFWPFLAFFFGLWAGGERKNSQKRISNPFFCSLKPQRIPNGISKTSLDFLSGLSSSNSSLLAIAGFFFGHDHSCWCDILKKNSGCHTFKLPNALPNILEKFKPDQDLLHCFSENSWKFLCKTIAGNFFWGHDQSRLCEVIKKNSGFRTFKLPNAIPNILKKKPARPRPSGLLHRKLSGNFLIKIFQVHW